MLAIAVEPGMLYFLQKFTVQFFDVVQVFKAAWLTSPVKVQNLKPGLQSLEILELFPFLNNDAIIAHRQKKLLGPSIWLILKV